MKKQSLIILLVALFISGCSSNNSNVEHVHTYSDEWSYTDNAHWHASTCGHEVKKDYGQHVFSSWNVVIEPSSTSEGLKERECNICTYIQQEVIPSTSGHTHTYSSTWSYDDDNHWHASTCGHDVISGLASHTFDAWVIDTEATETTSGLKHRDCTVCDYSQTEVIPSTKEEEQSEIDSIQDMNILHAWDWKLNDIKTRLKRIKKLGYGAIQISPMQPHMDGANGASGVTQDNWWKLYQPLGFMVATNNQNILGTKDDLTSLCSAASKLGLKIVVDVVTNHLAGNGDGYSSQVYKQYPMHHYGPFNDDSVQAVVQGHIGLPDIDTSNEEVQIDVLSMMKEYIDCGVSGYRFDAAKHIETPDDGEYASNFWPYVINGTTAYALEKGYEKPYFYGEILGTCGYGRSFSSYTKYMSVIDSRQSEDTLEAVRLYDTDYISTNYDTKEDPSKLVIWAESHDNYANIDNTTRDIKTKVINKTYIIQASRKDTATLYYARPANMDVSMCSIDDNGGWQTNEVKAINKFHDRYVDKSENMYTSNDCVINVRGTGSYAGASIVDLLGDSNTKTLTINGLIDGKYIDLISTNEFSVSNSKVDVSFTNDACILIPKDAYVPEEDDPDYVSSFVIEDAPTTYSYIAWVWGNGSSGAWRAFSKDQSAIGISLSSGEAFTIVEFPSGTTTNNASWDKMIRQTKDISYTGNQQIISFSDLEWNIS